MFTSKGFFSSIQCPYLDTCLLPCCIFAHSSSPVSMSAAAVESKNQVRYSDGEAQEGSRKRQKLDIGKEKSSSPPREAPRPAAFTGMRVGNDPTTEEKEAKHRRDHSSMTRPVSPPPIRRKLGNGKAVLVKPQFQSDSTPSQVPGTSSTPSKSPGISKASFKPPIMKETLNPRALKQAPAAHAMRVQLLKLLHAQLARLNNELAKDANHDEEELVLSEQGVITKALDIEEQFATQPTVYSNLIKNKIMAYKRMAVTQWKSERQSERQIELAKAKALEPSSTSTIAPRPGEPLVTGLSPNEEIAFLLRLVTPITPLQKHGYVTKLPTALDITTAKRGVETSHGYEICDRCRTRFQVFPGRRHEDGALATGGKCTYHYGKSYFTEKNINDATSKREKKLRCCGQGVGDSAGCTQSNCHVFKISETKRLAAILQFEKTPENRQKDHANPVCIDGEMGYTVHGLELVRLTATSWPSGSLLFDVLVRPLGEVLDLNSRFSGVYPSHFSDAQPYDPTSSTSGGLQLVPSVVAARELLFSHLSPSTPLIGHGLENDLNATRIIHPTIIDTVLLFPHKAGLPYRNGLKALTSQYLKKDIQVVKEAVEGEETGGHDSMEDANAAGDLVRWKVGVEWGKLKKTGWRIERTKLVDGNGLDGEEVVVRFVGPGEQDVETPENQRMIELDD